MRVSEYHDVVRPGWIDSNGHMNLAYYVVVFDYGSDRWMALAEFSQAYRQGGTTVFAVETHTLYRQEVLEGVPLTVRSWLIGADTKRIHLAHEMSSDGALVAMQEVLFVHVSLETRRVVPIEAAASARLQALGGEPPPDWLGRRIGLP